MLQEHSKSVFETDKMFTYQLALNILQANIFHLMLFAPSK